MIVDTLLINGTDIATITQLRVTSFDDFHRDGPWRGENLTIPGMAGAVSYAKVRDAYVMDLPIALLGDSRADFLNGLAAVRTLIGADNLVTLTRRLTDSTGLTFADTACDAEYVAGAEVSLLNPATGRTTLQFINLSGGWV